MVTIFPEVTLFKDMGYILDLPALINCHEFLCTIIFEAYMHIGAAAKQGYYR